MVKTNTFVNATMTGLGAFEQKITEIEKFAAPYQLRNARFSGPIENEIYNMNFKELEYALKILEYKINENNDMLSEDVVDVIEKNINLIKKISYLVKKYDYIKQYRFKGE
jgi:hypothetical protein